MISVIATVYNVEEEITRCIESIINQTYTDFELLLINDGSKDNSGVICDKYAALDKRIRVLHKDNGGVSEARNLGLDLAKGEYICFVDSDDYVDKKYLEIMLDMINEYDADIAAVSYENIYVKNAVFVESKDHRILLNGGGEVFRFFFKGDMVWGCPGKLIKKELFKGIRFLKNMKYEDYYTMPYLLDSCNKCVYSKIKLYYYYQREKSATHTTSVSDVKMWFSCMDKMLDYTNMHYKDLCSAVEASHARSVFWYVVDPSIYTREYLTIVKMVKDKMAGLLLRTTKSGELRIRNKIRIILFLFSPSIYRYVILVMIYIRSYARKKT